MYAVIAGGSAWTQHAQAVERLRASYAAIPSGQPVRLAKKTSNLFRPRQATDAAGLDVSGLDGVISVDALARTADVAGMTTYEHLVDATLPYGLMPLVVPQLRTITLGGAVSGLGIESTSFRSGLPHESVIEMDVFTGAGEVVTTRPGDDLFDAFPNSYGSLGYATRLRIELEPVRSHVALRHVRFDDAGLLAKTIAMITETREYAGEQVDGIDGVAFEPGEYYLTLARWSDASRRRRERGERLHRPADLLPLDPGARDRPADHLRLPVALGHRLVLVLGRVRCAEPAAAPGLAAQVPPVRRLLPDGRLGPPLPHRRPARQAGRPPAARAGHPGRRDPGRQAAGVPRLVRRRDRDAAGLAVPAAAPRPRVADVPADAATRRTSTSASGAPCTSARTARTRRRTARSRRRSTSSGGHKSLYSEAFYDRETFDRLYDGPHLAAVKQTYDPDNRLTSLYDKAVRRR